MTSKRKVLIIDGSKTSRSLIAKYLGDGYEYCMANDGKEGWQILSEEDSITLVFAAMDMPVLSGMQLLERIRVSESERISNTPVIIITGQQDSEAAKRDSYNAGATDFISKPFVKSEIRRCASTFTTEGAVDNANGSDVADKVQRDLNENKQLVDFGNDAITAAVSYKYQVSIMYLKIANLEKLIDKHDGQLIDKMIDKVRALLDGHSRNEENVFTIGPGKFVIT